MYKTKSGFTLVELLIVIVVIAILAAMSIVAYNGIQANAKNAALLQGVDTIVKGLEMYKIDHGDYPNVGGGYLTCVGATADYPASGVFPLGACYVDNPDPMTLAVSDDALTSALSSELGTIPKLSSYGVSTSGYDGIRMRGIVYQYVKPASNLPNSTYSLMYAVQGSDKKACGKGHAESPSDGGIICSIFPGYTW